ncbi:MAG: restriction endonuclease [Bifidobacterium sp.]|nr:restriction endonuclease [Bifidobacterium sp.]
MGIPTQIEMYPLVLEYMTDDRTRSNKQIKGGVIDALQLPAEDLKPAPGHRESAVAGRRGWAIQYLQRAGLLDRVARGTYHLSEDGRQLLAQHLPLPDFSERVNDLIAERHPWNSDNEGNTATEEPTKSLDASVSPQEAIESAMKSLNDSLADELLDLVLSKSPEFFEHLVVDLLERMGYGSGHATQYSNDGGIDGIVTTDPLGFDPIYTQAKRYARDHKVGRPEIQAFAGALGHRTRGVFITTSVFTKDAIEYAKTYPHATIVLIDGHKLAQLMIEHDLGVATERDWQVKRIDIDYFDQD